MGARGHAAQAGGTQKGRVRAVLPPQAPPRMRGLADPPEKACYPKSAVEARLQNKEAYSHTH